MQTNTTPSGSSQHICEVTPSQIVAELEADHRRELRKLFDLAFVFLNATDGDAVAAEKLLDNAVELLLEGGVLSTWRYKIVLNAVRAGL